MKFVDGKILSYDEQIKNKKGPFYERFIEKQNQLKIKIALEKAEKKNKKIEEKNKKRILENLPLIEKINLEELKNKVEKIISFNVKKTAMERLKNEEWEKSKNIIKNTNKIKKIRSLTCPICSVEFQTTHIATKFCSKKCSLNSAISKRKIATTKWKSTPEIQERLRTYIKQYMRRRRGSDLIGPRLLKVNKVFENRGRPKSSNITVQQASKLLLSSPEAISLKKESLKFFREEKKPIRQLKKEAKEAFINSLRNKENKSEVEKAFIKKYEYHEKIKKWKNSPKGKESIKKQAIKYYSKNRDTILNKAKIRIAKGLSKEWERKYKPQYIKKRRQEVPIFRLLSNVRSRFKSYLTLKKISKQNKTLELVGCSPQELKAHIEKYFRKGMSWENYGINTWHIDHIRPLSLAKSWDDIVRLKLMHYTNLRPLWAKHNLQKSDK